MAVKSKQASRSLRLNTEIAEIPVGKPIRRKEKAEKSGSTLYYGDNLSVLRDHIPSSSINLNFNRFFPSGSSQPGWSSPHCYGNLFASGSAESLTYRT
jgi:hypothetical protein